MGELLPQLKQNPQDWRGHEKKRWSLTPCVKSQSPKKEIKTRCYWWKQTSLASGDVSILEMPASCNDHQGQKQLWSIAVLSLPDKPMCSMYRKDGEVRMHKPLGSQRMSCESQMPNTEYYSVLKLNFVLNWLGLCPVLSSQTKKISNYFIFVGIIGIKLWMF